MSEETQEKEEQQLQYLSSDIVDKIEPKEIVTDFDELSKRRDIQEMNDEQITITSAELFRTLVNEEGLGLSTTQIGNPFRACIINVKEPLILINPRVVKFGSVDDKEDNGKRIIYRESCLSIPKTLKKPKKTVRATHVTVQTDNLGVIEFKPDKSHWKNTEEMFEDLGLLESVVAQHEINHLDGILITDKRVRYNKQVTVEKTGRNEKVMVMNPETQEISYMKYKHAQPLLELGYEIV